mmetsp:Transcript_9083/g.14364  ORF Transcript_9083/g.14364 Transcript_9083/m.14364 type:complete len:223 (+) Transcript_9083:588-1256(+)
MQGAEAAGAKEPGTEGLRAEDPVVNAYKKALLARSEERTLTPQGAQVRDFIADLVSKGDGEIMESFALSLQGLSLEPPYSQDSEEGSCGHKLSLEILTLPQPTGPCKMHMIQELLLHGLDPSAEWKDGRAKGSAGGSLLAAVLWLHGVEDASKLALAEAMIEGGMKVNLECVERSTTTNCGTFIIAGAMSSALHLELELRHTYHIHKRVHTTAASEACNHSK